jgi:hypothetical protein
MMGHRMPNHCVQATPDCALLCTVARVSGAPERAVGSANRYEEDWNIGQLLGDRSSAN